MIIRGGAVVTARGVEKADIRIAGDLITAVGLNLAGDGDEIDASGLHVFPGGIDSHVHFNEPGRTEWEDIAHGTAALAAGGYTSFVDMPLNNLPVTTDVAAFDLKVEAMKRSSKVAFARSNNSRTDPRAAPSSSLVIICDTELGLNVKYSEYYLSWISTSAKLPGIAAFTVATTCATRCLMRLHRPLPSTTIAILRPV